MENIKAVVRVRQILCLERKIGDASCVEVLDCDTKLEVKIHPTKTAIYRCSKFFPRLTPQNIIYDQCGVLNLFDRAMDGHAVNIFAYGEHRSGKTYTLFGPPNGTCERNLGVVQRSLKSIYEKLDALRVKYNVSLTCVQICEEKFYDMFVTQKERNVLSLQRSPTGSISVRDYQRIKCCNYSSAIASLEQVIVERCSSASPQNSHCVVEVHINLPVEDNKSSNLNEIDVNVRSIALGKISFVDLAGSEFITARTAEDGSLIHADHSLAVLSKTIDGVEKINNDNATVMDSALTALLCDSVGVPGCSLLISCIREGFLNITETVKTLQFSCVHVPKMLKYFDAQAKIAYDLQAQLHYLNRQNHKLRQTIIAAPTWELHTRTHNTPAAIKQEREQEKALIAMHNEILKANTTYQFKPRGGGRMYFPSPVAGRELPLKPKKYASDLSTYRSSGLLEGVSLLSSVPSKSRSESWGWASSSDSRHDLRNRSSNAPRSASRGSSREEARDEPSIELKNSNDGDEGVIGNSRNFSSRDDNTSGKVNKKVLALSATALDHILVRKHGATGPLVFRNKRAVRSPETAHDVPPIEPLKETTRLGFNKEGKDWPQEDWPKEIRERVASAVSSNERAKHLVRDPKLDATEPLFTWTPEFFADSPFVAHLIHKPKRALPNAPITTRVTPADERSVKFRPHTAPISEIAGPASRKESPPVKSPKSSDRSQLRSASDDLSRPASKGADRALRADSRELGSWSEDKGEAMKDDGGGIVTDMTISDSFDQAMALEKLPAPEIKKSRSRKSSASASRSGSASPSRPVSGINSSRPVSSLKRPVSGASRPASSGGRLHGAVPQQPVLPAVPDATTADADGAAVDSVPGSRPTSASIDSSGAFNPLRPSVFAASLMSDHSALVRRQSVSTSVDFNAMFGVPDDNRLQSLSPVQENTESSVASANRSCVSMKRQASGTKRLQRDSSNVSRLSSKSSSFSSLPSVDNPGPKMKQKSVSMKKF